MQQEKKYNDYEYPKVSVIVPVYNSAEKISLTLDSILGQIYPDFELIIVDAGSTDCTLRVINNYHDERIHVLTVSAYQRYEMLNRGISRSTGDYINCLFPGDFYIHNKTLQHMMEMALDNKKPDLVFCATLLREGKRDPKILLRPLKMDFLKKGQQPTSLQSCWIFADTLKMLGKFSSDYKLRGGFEFLCRFIQHPELRFLATSHVLTDYDLRLVTRSMVMDHFIETFRAIRKHFGIYVLIQWLFIQKDIFRLFRIWFRSVKSAFVRN